MIQPVTRDRNNEGEVIMMDMQDVRYIQTEDGTVVFYTDKGRFYPLVPSLNLYEKWTEGLDFFRLDRTNLVNMRKISRFDERHGVVYFDKNETIDEQSATVAIMRISKLKGIIRSWIDRNLGK
ncbi:LytTR family transcriptional regulator DNA-binding domain-containing protein [Cohnella suwonensis]|uniref:LytTR family transcriptional regulator DNA-binding domain-containing protein n=1 Tax=Cohnella suwonensis TaxID=696072 RepID=A0ABW0LZB1_9BACL